MITKSIIILNVRHRLGQLTGKDTRGFVYAGKAAARVIYTRQVYQKSKSKGSSSVRTVTREWRRGQIHTTSHTAKIVGANEKNILPPFFFNTAPVSRETAKKAVKTAKQQAAKKAAIKNLKRTKRAVLWLQR